QREPGRRAPSRSSSSIRERRLQSTYRSSPFLRRTQRLGNFTVSRYKGRSIFCLSFLPPSIDDILSDLHAARADGAPIRSGHRYLAIQRGFAAKVAEVHGHVLTHVTALPA